MAHLPIQVFKMVIRSAIIAVLLKSIFTTAQSQKEICELLENFYCNSSNVCLPVSLRCNGYTNCYYGEDEAGCDYTPAAYSTTTLSPRDSCDRQGDFFCASYNLCVPRWQRCNGYSDCYSGEDELGCGTLSPALTSASPRCGGTLYGNGYVRSPNFPYDYGNNLRCNWTLVANPYKGYIFLKFEGLATESCCDFLSIYNSTGMIGRFSGYSFPVNITLGHEAVVSFITDNSVVYSGFSIQFSTSAAGESPIEDCERNGNFYCASSKLCVPLWQRCNGNSYCYYGEDEAGCFQSTSSPATTYLQNYTQKNTGLVLETRTLLLQLLPPMNSILTLLRWVHVLLVR